MNTSAENRTEVPPLQLYGCWRSTCTHRVILAMRFYGLNFEYTPIDLTAREQETPEFTAISPDAQVPVLVSESMVLTQSLAIVTYADSMRRQNGNSLFPTEPAHRAQAIGLCERVSSFIQPLTLPGAVRRGIKQHFSESEDSFDARAADFITTTLQANLELLDRSIARHKGPFAMGQDVSVADIFVYPQLLGAQRLKLDTDQFPHLSALAQALEALDFVKAGDPLKLPDAP